MTARGVSMAEKEAESKDPEQLFQGVSPSPGYLWVRSDRTLLDVREAVL
jgi:hypothetical protein